MTLPQEAEPIKNTRDINKIKQYLYGKENKRDYCIFVVGINVGLRAGDLLSLKINDVTDGISVFDTVTIMNVVFDVAIICIYGLSATLSVLFDIISATKD